MLKFHDTAGSAPLTQTTPTSSHTNEGVVKEISTNLSTLDQQAKLMKGKTNCEL